MAHVRYITRVKVAEYFLKKKMSQETKRNCLSIIYRRATSQGGKNKVGKYWLTIKKHDMIPKT